jgi:hypothetical protein
MVVSHEYIRCSFCKSNCIKAKPGKTKCPECNSEFEIDDRLESIFANTDKIRLPAKGVVCGVCGLIQYTDSKYCLYCRIEINKTLQ